MDQSMVEEKNFYEIGMILNERLELLPYSVTTLEPTIYLDTQVLTKTIYAFARIEPWVYPSEKYFMAKKEHMKTLFRTKFLGSGQIQETHFQGLDNIFPFYLQTVANNYACEGLWELYNSKFFCLYNEVLFNYFMDEVFNLHDISLFRGFGEGPIGIDLNGNRFSYDHNSYELNDIAVNNDLNKIVRTKKENVLRNSQGDFLGYYFRLDQNSREIKAPRFGLILTPKE